MFIPVEQAVGPPYAPQKSNGYDLRVYYGIPTSSNEQKAINYNKKLKYGQTCQSEIMIEEEKQTNRKKFRD